MEQSEIKSRQSELTAVHNRNGFDALPGDVTDPADVERWWAFRDKYHRAHRLEEHFDFPLQIDFELNSTCQMKCSFCVHGVEKVPKRFLSFEDFARVIDEGSEYGLCSIKMNYINEPLLNRDLPRYIEYAKSKGVLNVYFATNGLLLSETVAEKLIMSGVSKIMVSLDATTPETFEAMRHSKHFEKIVRNILGLITLRKRLGVSWPLVRVNFVKTPLNVHEADEFILRWENVADMIGLQDQVGIPGADTEMLDADHGRKTLDTFRCSFPYKLMVVDSRGFVLPCCTFSGRDMPMGHVSEITIKQAWDSVMMRRLKLTHQDGKYRDNSVCLHCVGS